MTPVNHPYLSNFFPVTNPADSPSNEWITEIACDSLSELRDYTSEFSLTNCAIQQIPVNLNRSLA